MSDSIAVAELHLPEAVSVAVLGIPTAEAALGELRCLTEPVLAGLARRKKAGEYSGTDAALEAYLAVVARLAADHPECVAGAIAPADCGCGAVCSGDHAAHDYSRGGVKTALLEELGKMASQDRPGKGAYL